MIGNVNAVVAPNQLLAGLYPVGRRSEGFITYELYVDRQTLTPVVYRHDKKMFWNITWDELLNLARGAGLDFNKVQ